MKNETLKKISAHIKVLSENEKFIPMQENNYERVRRLEKAIMQKYDETGDYELLMLGSAVCDACMALADVIAIARHISKYPELADDETDPFMQKGAD